MVYYSDPHCFLLQMHLGLKGAIINDVRQRGIRGVDLGVTQDLGHNSVSEMGGGTSGLEDAVFIEYI